MLTGSLLFALNKSSFRSVLGAGNDRCIRVWDPHSGRVRHTMTGHSQKVAVASVLG